VLNTRQSREGNADHEPASFVPDAPAASERKLTGIGGWLILVALAQIFGPLKLLATAAPYYATMDGSLLQKFPVTFIGEAMINAFLIVFFIYVTITFFRRSKQFPRLFIIQSIVTVLILPMSVAWVTLTFMLYTGLPFEAFKQEFSTKELAQTLATSIAAALCITYTVRSKRVANTFVY
jgi:hypothetical protein